MGGATDKHEWRALICAFVLFFLLFASYFMLRPVRETFGIAGGVDNLQWLFLGTFVGALVVVPLYGWLAQRLPRSRLLPATYSFSALVMSGFAIGLLTDPENVWMGRGFYIWVSVFNLFVISIAWSFMADVFNPDQARRMFGRIGAGASLGGLTGPLLSGLLVEPVGLAGLLFISVGLLLSTLICVRYLLVWNERYGSHDHAEPASKAVGGGIWAGLTTIAGSPILLAISLFIVLLSSVTTFLYFEQARIVEATFTDRVAQTQVFSAIDVAVQSLTIFVQIFLTGLVARKLGMIALVAAVPFLMVAGFAVLALFPAFGVLAAVMILRRVGEYSLVRPGREMLFSIVPPLVKYKSKNAIDTVVYRGGDAMSAWLNSLLVAMSGTAFAAWTGAGIALIWALVGLRIGKWYKGQREDTQPA